MIFVYNLFLILLSLLFLPLILIIVLPNKKLKAGLAQKLGFYGKYKKQDKNKQTILFHAVSVGEVNAVENLIKTVRNTYPEYEIVISTTTKTGQEVATQKLKNFSDKIVYFPFDYSFSVKSFLKAIQPEKIIIAETEIWPNFSKYANKLNIPLYIINGRISPNSYKGYKKIKFFIRKVFKNYTKILMQTAQDAERILSVGATIDKVKIMGNLKFDIKQTLTKEEIGELNEEMNLYAKPLFVAASTHSGEDELVLDIYSVIKKQVSGIKLLIAPRHPERFSHVEELIKQRGFDYGKRSQKDNFANNDVIMLDTMGELSKMYSISKVAFIGGSFSNTGGHNPLEANIWGVPVISGPTVFNFKDIYKLLTASGAATIVNDEDEFANVLLEFLVNKPFYNDASKNIKQIFEQSSGAVQNAIKEIFE